MSAVQRGKEGIKQGAIKIHTTAPPRQARETQLSEFSDAVAEEILQMPLGSSTALPQFKIYTFVTGS